MPRPGCDITVSITIDRDEHADLREWAEGRDKNVAVVLREALNEHLARHGSDITIRTRDWSQRRKPGRPRKETKQ